VSTGDPPPAAPPPAAPRSAPIAAILVFAGACFFYIAVLACIEDLHYSDAAGRGLAAAFALIYGLVLWTLLGGLLAIAGIQGRMPLWAGITATVLLPLSGVSAAIAVDLFRTEGRWFSIVPVLLPPVIAAYAMWARLPQTHRALPPTVTSAVAWGAVLLLTLAPLPQFFAIQAEHAAIAARQEAERNAALAQEEQRRREKLARFEKLTADSPLWEWAEFINDKELTLRAVQGARALTHRQADAETALHKGMGFPLVEYGQLDLDVTPGFCAAAGDFLREDAAAHPPPDLEPYAAYDVVHQNFSPYLEGIEWLTQKDCDIDDAVTRIAQTVALYPQSSSRDGFLAVLAWRRGNGFYKRDDNERALDAYNEAIRLAPDNEQFLDSRGNVYYDKGDYDRAIADYDAAIARNKFYAAAFDSRANAYHEKGEDDRALPDYDEAIRLNPRFALAFNNRGNLYNTRGEHDRAIQDFDEALRLAPKFRTALSNRGRARFYQSDYPAAATDFAATLQLQPTDAYVALWLYLARARSGQTALEGLREDAGRLDRSAWPWPVVAAFLGDQDREAVLAAAHSGDETEQKGRQCEADFYLGAKAASEGDKSAAGDLLRQAQAVCPAGFIETVATKFELARLAP